MIVGLKNSSKQLTSKIEFHQNPTNYSRAQALGPGPGHGCNLSDLTEFAEKNMHKLLIK